MEWLASVVVAVSLVVLAFVVSRAIGREHQTTVLVVSEDGSSKERCGCSKGRKEKVNGERMEKQNGGSATNRYSTKVADQGEVDGEMANQMGSDDMEDRYKDEVVKFRSSKDRQYYFVAASLSDKGKAANKMAELRRREQTLLQALDERMDGGKRIVAADGVDITDNMRKLVKKHFGHAAPFAEYHNPRSKTVGVNNGKGEMIELCLRSKFDTSEWNADNTLFRVYVHELAHSADHKYRGDGDEAHGPDFRRIHEHLLQVAERLGLYSCQEYDDSNQRFCGLRLTEESKCGLNA